MMSLRFIKQATVLALLACGCLNVSAQPGSSAAAVTGAGASPVTGGPAVSDRELAQAVHRALHDARKQGLKSTYIRVHAHGGVITLTGVVANEDQVAFARSVAERVSGVRSVISKLQVRVDGNVNGSQ
jgi:hyperosmotically inducible periplasmic protein